MSTTLRNRRWWVAPLLAGALALTACGSDDDADATPADAPSDDADAASESEGDADADAAAESDSPGGGDFCAALADYTADVNDDPIADVAELEQLADVAPSEIADDMQSLAELSAQIYDFDEMTASEEEIAEFEAVLAEFEPVSARLDAWTTENCPDLVID